MWEAESHPQWQDYSLVCFAALACPLARFLLDSCVFQRLAERAIFPDGENNLKKIVRDSRRKKIPKFMESAWKLTYYTATVVLALLVTYKEPWFGNTNAFWHGWPNQSLKSFRVGSIVLVLHDVSDIFLESAKLCKYSGSELGASVLFGLFALSWGLLRLVYFPFWIIRSTSLDIIEHLDKSNPLHTIQYYAFNTLLLTLLIIHIYWWWLICRMISRQLQLQGRIPDDVRSDSDDD
ncbi:hypothetical protein AXG93_2717s1110 [Marchantia polymorpha subsp. ruderalis]|uniref:TLC domain-containing protein n=1 Tax=Marchantia polymorpha subsp. ruderalis TaxID=1480154 RepID=A0A176VRP9_MARPO|nr:hypothetical protein AXG93_2717s1110 [Marchantia polymorpha subsp. ruderalis]